MQATERPVFRQDLVAEAIDESGARYIDVMDPDSGNMFRFFEVEYALACAMDGQRDVAGIVKWAQEELGLTPSPKEVQTVIATLADLRFIETGAPRLSDVPEAKAAAMGAFDDEAATRVGTPAYTDQELGRGIVVGKPGAAAVSGASVELGNAGAVGARAAEPALPKADFDLGAPGAGAAAGARKPAAPVEDFALGAPGAAAVKAADKKPAPAADLSMDLTADMPVKAADVKEAVRQSKVMTAVEVPKELQDELEAKPSAAEKAAAEKAAAEKAAAEKAAAEKAAAEKAAAEKAAAEKAAAAKAAEKAAAAKAAEKKPAEKAADKKADKKPDKAAEKAAEKKPITLPKTAPEKTPVAPPAPKPGVSPVLVVLLILAVVGAGAYFFWKLVLDKPGSGEQTKAPPPKQPPPPPPADVTAKVTLETPPPQEIKSPAGTLETLEPADKEVKGGDVIATLVGAKALTTELEKLRADIDKATPAIEAATKDLSDAQQKENNEAGVKAAQAKLDRVKKPVEDKKATVVKKQADLEKLIVKTTIDGKLVLPNPAPKAGDKVTADQVIATVQKPTVPVAAFKIPPGTKVGADGNLTINAGGKTVVCTVSDAQAETIKVTCPPDSGLADGADVKFTLPK